MEESVKNKAVEALRGGLLQKITSTINSELGIDTKFGITVDHYPWCGWTVRLDELGRSAEAAVTCNQLLAQMFKTASLSAKVYHDGAGIWNFRVMIRYTHNFEKASNCIDVMSITIKGDEMKINK